MQLRNLLSVVSLVLAALTVHANAAAARAETAPRADCSSIRERIRLGEGSSKAELSRQACDDFRMVGGSLNDEDDLVKPQRMETIDSKLKLMTSLGNYEERPMGARESEIQPVINR
ncbi:hypothetical protein FB451DRAFT_1193510 [Mycena latifolia]|nr:hypothetical protein FB451DRAFT_1193510 [Mycena latifolia]